MLGCTVDGVIGKALGAQNTVKDFVSITLSYTHCHLSTIHEDEYKYQTVDVSHT